MSVDPVRLVMAIGLPAMLVVLACLAVFFWHIRESRTLVLASTSVFASFLLLAVQAVLELKTKPESDSFHTVLTIDRAALSIKEWLLLPFHRTVPGDKTMHEQEASARLARARPQAFQGDNKGRYDLTLLMAVFDIAVFIAETQLDWQGKEIREGVYPYDLGTSYPGGWTAHVSKPHECTYMTRQDVSNALLASNNPFAPVTRVLRGESLTGYERCLPPNTVLTTTSDSVRLQNPFCSITFVVQGGPRDHRVPGTLAPNEGFETLQGSPEFTPETLGSAEFRYETRVLTVVTTTTYFWERSFHPDKPKYERWARRVVSQAREWFDLSEADLAERANRIRELMKQPGRDLGASKEQPSKKQAGKKR